MTLFLHLFGTEYVQSIKKAFSKWNHFFFSLHGLLSSGWWSVALLEDFMVTCHGAEQPKHPPCIWCCSLHVLGKSPVCIFFFFICIVSVIFNCCNNYAHQLLSSRLMKNIVNFNVFGLRTVAVSHVYLLK